jgi:hypothetical protein
MKKRSKHHHRTSTFEQEMREFSGSLFMRQFAAPGRGGEGWFHSLSLSLAPASQQDLQLKMRALSSLGGCHGARICIFLASSRLVLNSVAAAEAAGGGVSSDEKFILPTSSPFRLKYGGARVHFPAAHLLHHR